MSVIKAYFKDLPYDDIAEVHTQTFKMGFIDAATGEASQIDEIDEACQESYSNGWVAALRCCFTAR